MAVIVGPPVPCRDYDRRYHLRQGSVMQAYRKLTEEELEILNDWVEAQGLPRGVLAFDFADQVSGEQKAVFDLAWPNGIQEELSQPVAVLLNENSETLALASRAGFRCFTAAQDFKDYVEKDILAGEGQGVPVAATGTNLPPALEV